MAGRTYGGKSADERRALQRRRFLDAGLELFGTIGYRATTVRALCKQAGLTDRYFYKNFDHMEACLIAVYDEAIAALQRKVVAALASAPDPEAAITAGLSAFFESFEDPRMARVCWQEVLGVSPTVDATYMRQIQSFADLLASFARTHAPKVDDEELGVLAVSLVGAIIHSALHWLLSDYAARRETLVAANARLLRAALRSLQAA